MLDRERFAFDKEKYERDHQLERTKAFATVWSVAVPLMAAVLAYIFQVWTRKRDETLQFQLKAAEIVMDARDTNQARRKAEVLTRLFPGRLGVLETALRQENFPFFGRSLETREELLKVLAQHPESRRDIIRAWEILFPWDSSDSGWAKKSEAEKNAYKWLDELKEDNTINQNRPPPASSA